MFTSRWHKLSVIFVLLLLSCVKTLPVFDGVDLDAWRADKHACEGKRPTMIGAIEAQSEKFLSLNEQDIVELLGTPDRNELYKRNQKFFYYDILPSEDCSSNQTTQQKKLVIRFNAIGLAKEVAVE